MQLSLPTFFLLWLALCSAIDFETHENLMSRWTSGDETLTNLSLSEAGIISQTPTAIQKSTISFSFSNNNDNLNTTKLSNQEKSSFFAEVTASTVDPGGSDVEDLNSSIRASTGQNAIEKAVDKSQMMQNTSTSSIIDKETSIPHHYANVSNLCQQLKCQHGAYCTTNGQYIACNCSWAFTGHLCESAFPLFLLLGLIGCSVLLFFFIGLSILLSVKVASKRSIPKTSSVDKKLNFLDAFNKVDETAIYADPSRYYGSICRGTLINRTSSNTLPRSRLNLESFENDHAIIGHPTDQQNGHYYSSTDKKETKIDDTDVVLNSL